MTNTLTQADLDQFYGDIKRYQHLLNSKVIYTPGIRYLADQGQAYWLIDAIATYLGSARMRQAIKQDSRIASMQFWRLEVVNSQGVLTAEADAGVTPFVQQAIGHTDFPLERVDIWAAYDGLYWTLYLPSEH
ncbi:MAG: hypothetical protein KDB27_21765 [Planctomycetales bacterium]|nr:hypothetical protein [Planctomycetales bacterium]